MPANNPQSQIQNPKLSAPSLRLVTGTLSSSPDRRTYFCRFVRAGRVRSSANAPSNIEITALALQSAWSSGLFNGKAVFIDHASLWDYPSLENLVGVTQSSTWNEEDESIQGAIKLYSTPSGISIAIVNCVDAIL